MAKKKNKQPEKTIAVLVEQGGTVSYLIPLLKETFNKKANVITINCDDINNNKALKNIDVLFIPGVREASASYRNGLGIKGGDKIKKWVKKGGTAVGLCQGGYLLTERFHYANKRTGITRMIHSPCGIFEGVAYGPVNEYTNRDELNNPFIDHHVAKLDFADGAKGAACYAHGPWLEISPNAKKKDYEVLARFAEVSGNPIAIAKRKYGKGKAIFSAVVPEISGTKMAQIDERFIPDTTPNGEHLKTGILFARELEKHEQQRQLVWSRLMMELK